MENPNVYEKIQFLKKNHDNLVLEMYFVTKDTTIKKAILENKTSEKLLKNFLEILEKQIDENTIYRDIKDLDETTTENEYFYFENTKIYDKLSHLINFWENKKIEDSKSVEKDIYGLIFKIKTHNDYLLIYQQCYGINILKKNSFFSLFTQGGVFKNIDMDILNISYRVDFLIDKDFFVILNLKPLEKQYGYKEIIAKEASNTIDVIRGMNFISNLKILEDSIKKNAKKIKNINKDVLRLFETQFDEVKSFIDLHDVLKDVLKFNEDNKMIVNNQKSLNYCLKLLSDDYLKSELTKTNYDSRSKIRV